jgi:hypothetical protein
MADREISTLKGAAFESNEQEKSDDMAHKAAERGNAATDKYGNFKIPSIS